MGQAVEKRAAHDEGYDLLSMVAGVRTASKQEYQQGSQQRVPVWRPCSGALPLFLSCAVPPAFTRSHPPTHRQDSDVPSLVEQENPPSPVNPHGGPGECQALQS